MYHKDKNHTHNKCLNKNQLDLPSDIKWVKSHFITKKVCHTQISKKNHIFRKPHYTMALYHID